MRPEVHDASSGGWGLPADVSCFVSDCFVLYWFCYLFFRGPIVGGVYLF
jgi:hypothetical protein